MTCVRFNKHIYPRTAIEKTMSKFALLADLKLSNEKRYWRVCATGISKDLKNIFMDEIANYVLGHSSDHNR